MKICGTCQTEPLVNSQKTVPTVPQSLDAQVLKSLPKGRKHFHHSKKQKFVVHGLRPETTLYYFGAMPRNLDKPLLTKNYAYAKLANSGVTSTNHEGTATIYLECPQVYIYDDGKVYHRHFHFVYWDKTTKKWGDQLYTQPVLCSVDLAFVKENQHHVLLVDALSRESFKKDHIHGSVNLPANGRFGYQTVRDFLIEKTTTKTLEHHLHKIDQTPVIVYCWDAQCNAAKKTIEKLNALGFHNIFYFSGGLSEWNSHSHSH